ncbi:MAG: metallophosphoesterase family protein [Lentisphaeria bacterium]|nr:metallophosphoesterase family protein [Lentisphaeria bacterium]
MKYAIFSDIHGNLEALNAILEVCRNNNVDEYYCLGDIVGYNANPKECMEIVRKLPGFRCVKGNHDEYATNGQIANSGFNPHAKLAVMWTQAQLSEEEKNYLSNLPMRENIRGINMTLVHATLDGPESWGYIFDVYQAEDNFANQFTQLCFYGHTHVPAMFAKKPVTMVSGRKIEEIPEWADRREGGYDEEEMSVFSPITCPILPGYKYLINIGSVGQPRNRDRRASFVIYDSNTKMITRYRVPYDFQTAQKKILEAGLPERLANRLERGM